MTSLFAAHILLIFGLSAVAGCIRIPANAFRYSETAYRPSSAGMGRRSSASRSPRNERRSVLREPAAAHAGLGAGPGLGGAGPCGAGVGVAPAGGHAVLHVPAVGAGPLPAARALPGGPSVGTSTTGQCGGCRARPGRLLEKAAAFGPLSWNALAGKYIVYVADVEVQHKIFSNVHAQGFELIAHPFGKRIFGKNNMIMMRGEQHKDLRRRLLPLFTAKALGVYVQIQEATIRAHLSRWLAADKRVEMRPLVRALNLETSQTVFVGPYLTPALRTSFTHDYAAFNAGLMAFPLDLPGTTFYKGARAVSRIAQTLAVCAAVSKERTAETAEPACLMDYWTASMQEELRAAAEQGRSIPEHCSDLGIGQHVFDFHFAAQDASSSSLLWVMALLEAHPTVLARVWDEQRALRPDRDAPLSADLLARMRYTKQVALEVLRLRPPAPLVPHLASVDYPLTPDYTVPKGTIVFPSVFDASFQGFTEPHSFDPDRFSEERREDVCFKRNWLLFGAGPHQCLGQRYAINHIMVFIALISSHLNWERVRTPGCDDLAYQPTIYPKDGVQVTLSSRPAIYAIWGAPGRNSTRPNQGQGQSGGSSRGPRRRSGYKHNDKALRLTGPSLVRPLNVQCGCANEISMGQ